MIEISHIDHLVYRVVNVDKIITFYETVLGATMEKVQADTLLRFALQRCGWHHATGFSVHATDFFSLLQDRVCYPAIVSPAGGAPHLGNDRACPEINDGLRDSAIRPEPIKR